MVEGGDKDYKGDIPPCIYITSLQAAEQTTSSTMPLQKRYIDFYTVHINTHHDLTVFTEELRKLLQQEFSISLDVTAIMMKELKVAEMPVNNPLATYKPLSTEYHNTTSTSNRSNDPWCSTDNTSSSDNPHQQHPRWYQTNDIASTSTDTSKVV